MKKNRPEYILSFEMWGGKIAIIDGQSVPYVIGLWHLVENLQCSVVGNIQIYVLNVAYILF